MSLVGIVSPGQFVSKFSDASKRDASEPSISIKRDKLLSAAALAIPTVTMALCLFFGANMYDISGLELSRSGNGGFILETDEAYVKSYCWSHLAHFDNETGEVIPLYHYPYFPFIVLTMTLALYTTEIFWRFIDMYHLSQGLDYILDGLEESIRDVMDFLLEDLHAEISAYQKTPKPPRNDKLTISNAYHGSVEIKAEKKRLLNETVVKLHPVLDSLDSECSELEARLSKDLKHRQKTKQLDKKYKYFNMVLERFASSAVYSQKIRYLRIYLMFILSLVEGAIFWFYLRPKNNPMEINCPLPPHMYYTDEETNQKVTFILAIFPPVAVRTKLMWTMWVSILCLIIAAALGYRAASNKSNTRGFRLMKKLPSVTLDEAKFSKDSDLRYLTELVYANRWRLQYVKFAFNILGAADSKKKTGASKRKYRDTNFLSVFRETMMWLASSKSDGQLNRIVAAGIDNMTPLSDSDASDE